MITVAVCKNTNYRSLLINYEKIKRLQRLTVSVLLHQALTLVFHYEARFTHIKYICK